MNNHILSFFTILLVFSISFGDYYPLVHEHSISISPEWVAGNSTQVLNFTVSNKGGFYNGIDTVRIIMNYDTIPIKIMDVILPENWTLLWMRDNNDDGYNDSISLYANTNSFINPGSSRTFSIIFETNDTIGVYNYSWKITTIDIQVDTNKTENLISKVDFEKPNLTDVNLKNGSILSCDYYLIQMNASDFNGSGISNINISLDNENTWVSANGTNPWTYNMTCNSSGEQNLSIKVIDKVGNYKIEYYTFSFDKNKPSVIINSPLNNSWYNDTFSLNISVIDDNIKEVKYRLENNTYNSSWLNMTNSSGFYVADVNVSELYDGQYIIRINATDEANNFNDTEVILVGIDVRSPIITNLNLSSKVIYLNETLNISVKVESPSQVSSVWYNITYPNGSSFIRDMTLFSGDNLSGYWQALFKISNYNSGDYGLYIINIIFANNSFRTNNVTFSENFTLSNLCGNKVCEVGESCSSCSSDCGTCSSGGGGRSSSLYFYNFPILNKTENKTLNKVEEVKNITEEVNKIVIPSEEANNLSKVEEKPNQIEASPTGFAFFRTLPLTASQFIRISGVALLLVLFISFYLLLRKRVNIYKIK